MQQRSRVSVSHVWRPDQFNKARKGRLTDAVDPLFRLVPLNSWLVGLPDMWLWDISTCSVCAFIRHWPLNLRSV
jgi:hypothetical protein